ncbi:MAG: 4Fe-4S ferredoxin [Deltaproteobacteria bacterium]|nr:4Fe-4S ferredoxin [Deltaproteobacteria bacterium]
MSEIYIAKDKFPSVLGQLMGKCPVFGPVLQGKFHEFGRLERPEDVDLGYGNTRLSPKALFHPQAEKMFDFSLSKGDPEAGILKETPKDFRPRVILGIRPCDARAFQLDDRNFDTDSVRDPWWVRRRETTTLVGLACNTPGSTCFCTSVGTGPFDKTGLDVLMVDVGEGYLFQASTKKGEEFLAGLSAGEAVSGSVAEKADALKKGAEGSMGTQFSVDAIVQNPTLDLFNAAFWDEVQFSCINCGTCTFVCPTCWCFDIQDEVYQEKGSRIRLWDSCMFPLFTFHGSGHNPRSQKLQRVRQRFMHKLKYYPEKYKGGVACVGCGRCVRQCPVNIDIRHVARLMSASCVCPT